MKQELLSYQNKFTFNTCPSTINSEKEKYEPQNIVLTISRWEVIAQQEF